MYASGEEEEAVADPSPDEVAERSLGGACADPSLGEVETGKRAVVDKRRTRRGLR